MANPSPSWNSVRVYGTWRGQDGALKAGTYKVTIPARITNATDDAIIPAGTFASGALQVDVPGSPSFDMLIPATDDPDNEQTGWKVTVNISFPDAGAENYVIDVPVAARPLADGGTGVGVNLRTVAMSTSIPQQVALYRVGVPGGLAKLDATGQVVDASGDPVTGSGAGPVAWGDVTGKPSNFLPSTHAHPTSDVTGLDTALAGKAASVHTHTIANVTGLQAALDAKGTSNLTLGTTSTTAKAGDYTPTKTDVGLGNVDNTSDANKPVSSATQTALAGKSATGHTHAAASVTGLSPVATTGAMADIGGTLNLGQLAPGGTFTIIWNGTNWRYNGANITARPSARTNITMIAMGGTTAPNFGLADVDIWLKDLA